MNGLRSQSILLFILLGLAFPGLGWSNVSVPDGYRSVALEHGIPHDLFYAVALTESGKQVKLLGIHRPWPWTLNVGGHGYFYDSKRQAWQALIGYLRDGKRSIDIGLMMVNWRYHQERLGTPWQALDPYFNLRVGAEILQGCYRNEHDWWASVGCYHAPSNQRRADKYRRRVVSRWQRIVSAG